MYYFDRYNTSIKDATRCHRACEAAREYKLTMNAPLPQQQVVLSVTKNKVQLIDVICEELQKLDDVPQLGHYMDISCTNGSEKRHVGPTI